jgi:hypothetical protein
MNNWIESALHILHKSLNLIFIEINEYDNIANLAGGTI